jgi:hypothetical protein
MTIFTMMIESITVNLMSATLLLVLKPVVRAEFVLTDYKGVGSSPEMTLKLLPLFLFLKSQICNRTLVCFLHISFSCQCGTGNKTVNCRHIFCSNC